MFKEITRNDVLNLLRQHETRLSKHPDSNIKIIIRRQHWNEDTERTEPFYIKINFIHPNYIYLLSKFYNPNENKITDDNAEINIFSLVPQIKTIIKNLENDGYLIIDSQKCIFRTEFGKEIIYEDFDGQPLDRPHETYINAKEKFSEDELLALNSAIILTTKGQGNTSFFIEKLFSEPVGTISLILGIVSIFFNYFF